MVKPNTANGQKQSVAASTLNIKCYYATVMATADTNGGNTIRVVSVVDAHSRKCGYFLEHEK